MMRKRLTGFTVIELLVVMIISSVGVGIAYASYRIVNGQFISYHNTSKEISQYLSLEQVLARDIQNAEKILRTSQGFRVISLNENIEYRIENDYVLRKPEQRDTFFVHIREYTTSFNNRPENIPDALIDRVELECEYRGEVLGLVFQKEYGADVLMESPSPQKGQKN